MAVWSEATTPSCYDHTFAVAFQPLYIYIYIYGLYAHPPPPTLGQPVHCGARLGTPPLFWGLSTHRPNRGRGGGGHRQTRAQEKALT